MEMVTFGGLNVTKKFLQHPVEPFHVEDGLLLLRIKDTIWEVATVVEIDRWAIVVRHTLDITISFGFAKNYQDQ